MLNWLKEGGRKEKGSKFWLKVGFVLIVILGAVTLVIYNMIPSNQ